MVDAEEYIAKMKEACIPMGKEEMSILTDMVIQKGEYRGKFNEEMYMHRVKMQASAPFTRNQEFILRMLATVDQKIREIRQANGGK